ncbi:MAG TPA: FAD-dependent oxidoreductase, partial [Pyrinomonadaceae bacterium]|nr:FAD-dependent oxidoreductase [Pyrinomonadaceae bacterium]
RSALRSFTDWQQLAATTHQSVFCQTGVLWLARNEDAYVLSTRETLERTGVRLELLSRSDLEQQFPQISFGKTAWGILEPDSGVLMARQAVQALVKEAETKGVTFIREKVVPSAREGGPVQSDFGAVSTHSGKRISAGMFVFACGPWLGQVFPELLGELIHVTRQEVLFFGVPPGDSRFSPPAMPTWIDFNDLVYCLPEIEGRGVKIAIDAHGPEFDPESGDRTVTAEGVQAGRKHLAERLRALADAPVLETRVCQYENTSNGDFLIDRHPEFDNVWLVGGGSGHGFKHGPAVGEYLTAQLLGREEVEPRFSLSTKAKVRHRAVF